MEREKKKKKKTPNLREIENGRKEKAKAKIEEFLIWMIADEVV